MTFDATDFTKAAAAAAATIKLSSKIATKTLPSTILVN